MKSKLVRIKIDILEELLQINPNLNLAITKLIELNNNYTNNKLILEQLELIKELINSKSNSY